MAELPKLLPSEPLARCLYVHPPPSATSNPLKLSSNGKKFMHLLVCKLVTLHSDPENKSAHAPHGFSWSFQVHFAKGDLGLGSTLQILNIVVEVEI